MSAVTAKLILLKLGEGALKAVGAKIIQGLLPGVFGNDDDFDELKKKLEDLSKKLDDILLVTRSTFELVQSLPSVVSAIVDEQTLYFAKTKIESSMSVYLLMDVEPNIISQAELTELTQSFTILIDKEHKTDIIAKLPKYSEYLLSATSGKMFDLVYLGITNKLNAISSALRQTGEELESRCNEAEQIIASAYIKSGNLFDETPWLTWAAADDRIIRGEICVPVCLPPEANGGCWTECHPTSSPDTAWNNTRNNKAARLSNLRTEIATTSKTYMSLKVSEKVLKTYKQSLEDRRDAILNKQTGFYALDGNLVPFEYREGFSIGL